MPALHFDCLIPDWPAPAPVRAVCSTRDGGRSLGPYAGLNLGLHVGDVPSVVQGNRQQLQQALGTPIVFLNQVHGCASLEIAPDSPDGLQADGAHTVHSGVACAVMVADCLPVLICSTDGAQVAAAHAGWRGLLGEEGRGILEASVATFGKPGSRELMAWLGPCIGPQAFEVGQEVQAAFVAARADAAAHFQPRPGGKWLADLAALARQRLQAQGVKGIYGNDGSQAWCTVGNPSRFFSHRRDGVSGRMAACIWRAA